MTAGQNGQRIQLRVLLYCTLSQANSFGAEIKLSTSRVKVQITAFENKSKHPVSTGFSSVALSEESPLLSNGFKFSSELFNPCSAAILSNLLIPTYPLRRKLQDNTFCELSKDQAGRHGILCSKRS